METIFAGFFGGDQQEMARANDEIKGYFEALLHDRVEHPGDTSTDFVSFLLQAKMGDRPITHDEILTLCATIMLAGLDTTRSALGYIFHHLATHEDHRRLLIDHPEKIPDAVEEFLRLYALVIQDGRYVEEDIEFHGCPMKRGDIVWLGHRPGQPRPAGVRQSRRVRPRARLRRATSVSLPAPTAASAPISPGWSSSSSWRSG